MKKISSLYFIFSIFYLVFGIFGFARAALVPCGGTDQAPCTLCHFFAGFSNIINFIAFGLTPPIAMLIFLIGGIMLLTAGGNEQRLSKAKQLVTNAVIGLLIIYLGWLLMNSLITTIGQTTGNYDPTKWFQAQCRP